eukprot:scaffold8081_cov239-Pinguiococcus_pyrenoidosus.AAC.1
MSGVHDHVSFMKSCGAPEGQIAAGRHADVGVDPVRRHFQQPPSQRRADFHHGVALEHLDFAQRAPHVNPAIRDVEVGAVELQPPRRGSDEHVRLGVVVKKLDGAAEERGVARTGDPKAAFAARDHIKDAEVVRRRPQRLQLQQRAREVGPIGCRHQRVRRVLVVVARKALPAAVASAAAGSSVALAMSGALGVLVDSVFRRIARRDFTYRMAYVARDAGSTAREVAERRVAVVEVQIVLPWLHGPRQDLDCIEHCARSPAIRFVIISRPQDPGGYGRVGVPVEEAHVASRSFHVAQPLHAGGAFLRTHLQAVRLQRDGLSVEGELHLTLQTALLGQHSYMQLEGHLVAGERVVVLGTEQRRTVRPYAFYVSSLSFLLRRSVSIRASPTAVAHLAITEASRPGIVADPVLHSKEHEEERLQARVRFTEHGPASTSSRILAALQVPARAPRAQH